jgi:hypothetical protein
MTYILYIMFQPIIYIWHVAHFVWIKTYKFSV